MVPAKTLSVISTSIQSVPDRSVPIQRTAFIHTSLQRESRRLPSANVIDVRADSMNFAPMPTGASSSAPSRCTVS